MVVAIPERLAQGEVVILDGGMGTELQRRGVNTAQPLWSTNALLADPDAVRTIHEDYIAAGSEVIITVTYKTNRRNLARAGLAHRLAELNRRAVQLAHAARDRAAKGRQIFVAGALGPLEASYHPELVPPLEEAREEYREQTEALAEAGVDLIIAETMSKLTEAEAALEAGISCGLPTWIGLTCGPGGRLLSGETMAQAAATLGRGAAGALLINCTPARYVSAALQELAAHSRVPTGVYANIGRWNPPLWEFPADFPPAEYGKHALHWAGVGAQIIGGCCGTTPEYIRRLRQVLAPGG